LHNYRGLDLGPLLRHWWPLFLILWGVVKLYDRSAGSSSGDPGTARVTAGEVFLVLGLLSLVGIVVAADLVRGRLHERGVNIDIGDDHSFDLDVAPKAVPPNARIAIRWTRGDITVSDFKTPVTINGRSGDIEVRDTAADVSIDANGGDIKVSDTRGDVKISGRGGEVAVTSATGSLTLNGEFVGPIRTGKVAKGVRFVSHRTDLTLTQLSGHLETESGNLHIVDAPGSLSLRTNRYDISIEN